MRKVLLAVVFGLLLIILSAQDVLATQIFYDTFDRTNLFPPYTTYVGSCGGSSSIVSGKMRQSTNDTCLVLSSVYLGQVVRNFTYEFQYTHQTGNMVVAEWTNETHGVSISFDTVKQTVGMSAGLGQSIILDFENGSLSYPYPQEQNITYIFNGFSASSTHNITMEKEGYTITIYIDGNYVVAFTNQNNNVPMSHVSIATFRSTGYSSGYGEYDNVRVNTETAKIIPNIQAGIFPVTFNPFGVDYATLGTGLTATCIADNPTIPLSMKLYSTPVSNPYAFTPSVGLYVFTCTSNETETYASSFDVASVNVTQATTSPSGLPTTLQQNLTSPVFNILPLEQVGLGFIGFFFTPLFMSMSFIVLISTIVESIAKSKGLAFGVSMLLFTIGLTIGGYLPIWVAIIYGVLASFLIGRFVVNQVSGD